MPITSILNTQKPLFITGTDTEIGKTWASLAVMQALQNQGLRVAGMKPVASGSEMTPTGLRNEDALHIQQQASFEIPYKHVNPYAFAPPIAPHIAAQQRDVSINLKHIQQTAKVLQSQADVLVVEGVGGWRVPLGQQNSLVDLVKCLDAQVILVVGLRLGCINHALLSAEVIAQDGCKCVGWIANQLQPEVTEQNAIMETLKHRLSPDLIGVLPYQKQQNITALAASIEQQ